VDDGHRRDDLKAPAAHAVVRPQRRPQRPTPMPACDRRGW
jgi:hypothetical protein